MNEVIKNRYDFIFLFDVKDGNPNGDPDQLNIPRTDIEDQHGLVTDVCIKRKIRNYVQIKHKLEFHYDIFIRQRDINADDSYLNAIIDKSIGDTIKERKKNMCQNFWDIRTFGAVLSTNSKETTQDNDEQDNEIDGTNKVTKTKKAKKTKGAGTVRGTIQLTFARSIDIINPIEHTISRCCVTDEVNKNKQLDNQREYASTLGKKSTIPYALYMAHGFISTIDAQNNTFSEEDLSLFWESLVNCFEHDRASARGEMNPVKIIIFKHSNPLGNELSGRLFSRLKIEKSTELPRKIEDYKITLDKTNVPNGIDIKEWPEDKIY